MLRQTTLLPAPEAISQARERTSDLALDYMRLVKLAEHELENSTEDAWDQILDNFPPQARHLLDPRSKARSSMPSVQTSGPRRVQKFSYASYAHLKGKQVWDTANGCARNHHYHPITTPSP